MPTLDQYLAESGRQGELDQIRATPGGYEKAVQQFNSTGRWGNAPSSSSNSGGFQNTVQQAIEMNQKANQPAVASLQASIPEIGNKYAQQRAQTQAQIEPLKQRYQTLLEDVKNQGQTQVNNQTKITNNELGKRGIVGSSTLASQEIQNAVQPIQGQIATNTKNIGLEQEQGLMALQNLLSGFTTAETADTRAVQNAIAQLQSGAGQAGVQQGLSMFQQQQQNDLAEKARAAAQAQQDIENRRADQLFPLQLQGAQADLQAKLNANKASSVTYNPFGTNQSTGQPFTGNLSFGKNTADLIAQGKYQEALNLMQNP